MEFGRTSFRSSSSALESVQNEVTALEDKWYAVCKLLHLEMSMDSKDALGAVCEQWNAEHERSLAPSTLRRWKATVWEQRSLRRKVLEKSLFLFPVVCLFLIFRKVTPFEKEVNDALRDVYDTYGNPLLVLLLSAQSQVVLDIVY